MWTRVGWEVVRKVFARYERRFGVHCKCKHCDVRAVVFCADEAQVQTLRKCSWRMRMLEIEPHRLLAGVLSFTLLRVALRALCFCAHECFLELCRLLCKVPRLLFGCLTEVFESPFLVSLQREAREQKGEGLLEVRDRAETPFT